jgi:hypothetical protein
VLPVDIEQQFAHAAQQADRNALAVDPGAAPAVGADHPAQQQFTLVRDRLLLEYVAQLAAHPGDIHRGAEVGALGARAHRLSAGASTAQQLEGVDQHRLARAGFSGEYGQPAAQVDFDGVDDGQVADLQVAKHGGLPSVPGVRRRGPSAAWSATGGRSRSREGAAG